MLIDTESNAFDDLIYDHTFDADYHAIMQGVQKLPAVDAVPVVRCKDCVYAVAPDPHADLLTTSFHCQLYRGDEVRNVWHKYKKYYKDYSVVFSDDYCSAGERRDSK